MRSVAMPPARLIASALIGFVPSLLLLVTLRQAFTGDDVQPLEAALLADLEPDFFNRSAAVGPLARGFVTETERLLLSTPRMRCSTTMSAMLVRSWLPPIPQSFWMRRTILLGGFVELFLTKREIMTSLVTNAYFGSGRTGVTDAARHYFDKSPQELSVAESAFLAVLVQTPRQVLTNDEVARVRVTALLKRMNASGQITNAERDSALADIDGVVARAHERAAHP